MPINNEIENGESGERFEHRSHPMEKILGIEPGSTLAEVQEKLPAELAEHIDFDAKDQEIEKQLQEVYDLALQAYDAQMLVVEDVDGKYAARNAEVAVQFLRAALDAANSKSMLKQHKDRIRVAERKVATSGNSTTNNNIIVANRNELLKMMNGNRDQDPLDADFSEVSNDKD